jgi:hypothetical protein
MSEKQLQPASYGIRRTGLPHAKFYACVREGIIPAGVIVRFGRSIYIDPDKLEEFLAAGGKAFPGGWRRAPR